MAKLAEKLQNGDTTAFDEIYRRCSGYVSFVCTKFCENKEDIEEIVQDTFHIAYKNAAQIQSKTILAYLRKVAVHECFRRRKANSRYTHLVASTDELDIDCPEIDEALLPEHALHNKESQRQLLLVIDRLPKLQREIVYLYYYVDIDAQHIAELMDCSVGSVYSVLTRARKAIRLKLEEGDDRTRAVFVKSLVLLPLAALFLAEESTYLAAYVIPATGAAAVAGAAGVTATTSTGAVVGYITACVVTVGLAASTYFIALRPEQEPDPTPNIAATTPAPTSATPTTKPIVQNPINNEPAPVATEPTATEPPPLPTTPAPTTAAITTLAPTTPPPTPAPTTIPPTTIPADRTQAILAALAQASIPADVAHIIQAYDFAFETQATTFTDQILRFYLRDEGSGDILIGTSTHADGTGWFIRYRFFDGQSTTYDGTAMYRWMRGG